MRYEAKKLNDTEFQLTTIQKVVDINNNEVEIAIAVEKGSLEKVDELIQNLTNDIKLKETLIETLKSLK